MKILDARGKLRRAFMHDQNEFPDKIEYYFIDTEGNKIVIFPYERILGGAFINCFRIDNKQELTIHSNRLQWKRK